LTAAAVAACGHVQYLKYDNCGTCKYGYTNTPAKIMQVTRMGDALRRWGAEGTGRPIFYSTEMVRRRLRPLWRPFWLRFTYVTSVIVKKC
jgi:hypothetical protein